MIAKELIVADYSAALANEFQSGESSLANQGCFWSVCLIVFSPS